jgi:glycogen operon protein
MLNGDAHWVRSIGMRLDGRTLSEVDTSGNLIVDDDLLLLLNAHTDPVPFTIPMWDSDAPWELEIEY